MKKPSKTWAPNVNSRPFLILLNNPKQPLHARNSFTNQIFWKRIINDLKKR